MQYDKNPFKSAMLLELQKKTKTNNKIPSHHTRPSAVLTNLFNIQKWKVLRQEIWHQVRIGIRWLV